MHNYPDLNVTVGDNHVATVEINRPPHNYFDRQLIASLADAFTALDDDPSVRVSILCSNGKSFCAGADFHGPSDAGGQGGSLYGEAVRLFSNRKPVVGAIQGAAVGGGLGVALFPDFRIAAPEARFSANFSRLGFHHGFALSTTLVPLVGQQMALDMLYTGRRVTGEEAFRKGLCDRLVPLAQLRDEAEAFAVEIARSAPLAVMSIRATMRGDIAQRVKAATDHEIAEQSQLQKTADFAEGIRAMADRRLPDFRGR